MDNIDFTKVTEHLLLIQKALENTSEGVSISDVNGDDMPLVYVNKAFYELTGYTPEDVIGKNCRFLQADDRDQKELLTIKEALRNGKECTVTLRNYKKTGELFYNKLYLSPIYDQNGMLTHYVGIQSDVTDVVNARKALEEANEELLEANARLNELMSIAIQDIRDPLAKASNTIELIRKLKADNEINDREVNEKLKELYSLTNGIAELVDDIIHVKEIDKELIELDIKEFDISDAIRKTLTNMAFVIDEKDLEIKLCLPDNDIKIRSDRVWILAILDSLISNSLRYAPEDTEVMVSLIDNNNSIKIELIDHGEMIYPNRMNRLFEFTNKSIGDFSKSASTGFGLMIIRKIVDRLGGNLVYENLENGGVKFLLDLPKVLEE